MSSRVTPAKAHSLQDKLCGYAPPVVKPMPQMLLKKHGAGTIGVPSPLQLQALIQRIPHGQLATVAELSDAVVRDLGAKTGCTVTTGICAALVANAAAETETLNPNAKHATPYWRALKIGGELSAKYPGGIDGLKQRLEAEGHTVVQKRQRFFVENFARKLIRF